MTLTRSHLLIPLSLIIIIKCPLYYPLQGCRERNENPGPQGEDQPVDIRLRLSSVEARV